MMPLMRSSLWYLTTLTRSSGEDLTILTRSLARKSRTFQSLASALYKPKTKLALALRSFPRLKRQNTESFVKLGKKLQATGSQTKQL